MSAIGSIFSPNFRILECYQDDLVTPGIKPWLAISLKQIRQMPNFRKYPRLLPHLAHLRTILVENFGFLFALSICDVFAIIFLPHKAFFVMF